MCIHQCSEQLNHLADTSRARKNQSFQYLYYDKHFSLKGFHVKQIFPF